MTLVDPPPTASLADLVARYDGRAPRYTSYPTAVQFTPAVDAEVYRRWLAAVSGEARPSLYLHVPFCSRLCWYCGCNTRAVNRHAPVRDYVAYLRREAALLGGALPGRLSARSVHFGGGTPNMLKGDDLDALFAGLGDVFDLTDLEEVAAELDPAMLTREWVQAAAGHGLNRASLGVQNLAPEVQAAVNRHEAFDQIAAGMDWLREAGVSSINVDLMYGLPRQTTANTLATIDAVAGLSPERIALFGYAHVPWMKAHQKLIDESLLPGAAERIDQSEAAAERLVRLGYVRIGLDHFARPDDALARAAGEGRLRRNFQGYTTDEAETLLGLGASAIGRLAQGYVQNHAQEREWRAALDAGRLPVAKGVAFTTEDLFTGEIIERLMCDLSIDLAATAARHGRRMDELEPALARLKPMFADGLARLDGERLRVVGHGRLVLRSICAAFDSYLDPSARRHAKAI